MSLDATSGLCRDIRLEVRGDCEIGSQGALQGSSKPEWAVSFAECAEQCRQCTRCNYVSVSLPAAPGDSGGWIAAHSAVCTEIFAWNAFCRECMACRAHGAAHSVSLACGPPQVTAGGSTTAETRLKKLQTAALALPMHARCCRDFAPCASAPSLTAPRGPRRTIARRPTGFAAPLAATAPATPPARASSARAGSAWAGTRAHATLGLRARGAGPRPRPTG